MKVTVADCADSERGQRPVMLENPDLPALSLTCTMQRSREGGKKPIRLGKGDEKGKETEVTCFCSWLSDAEADGSGQNCSARKMLYRPRLESGERERKEKGG